MTGHVWPPCWLQPCDKNFIIRVFTTRSRVSFCDWQISPASLHLISCLEKRKAISYPKWAKISINLTSKKALNFTLKLLILSIKFFLDLLWRREAIEKLRGKKLRGRSASSRILFEDSIKMRWSFMIFAIREHACRLWK